MRVREQRDHCRRWKDIMKDKERNGWRENENVIQCVSLPKTKQVGPLMMVLITVKTYSHSLFKLQLRLVFLPAFQLKWHIHFHMVLCTANSEAPRTMQALSHTVLQRRPVKIRWSAQISRKTHLDSYHSTLPMAVHRGRAHYAIFGSPWKNQQQNPMSCI